MRINSDAGSISVPRVRILRCRLVPFEDDVGLGLLVGVDPNPDKPEPKSWTVLKYPAKPLLERIRILLKKYSCHFVQNLITKGLKRRSDNIQAASFHRIWDSRSQHIREASARKRGSDLCPYLSSTVGADFQHRMICNIL
jgi:hypothetical protein